MSRATYACTALLGSNKAGILKPDADGYYPVVLGALDVFNSVGSFYPFETAKHLFQQSSSLMRRIANGACRAEYGHPKKEKGWSDMDFINRLLIIEEKNVCAHIKDVTIDYTSIKDKKTGRPVIAILGKVKPMGPYGDVLRASFENPNENVCFSIRSLTDDVKINDINNKNIRIIVCWDYVNEPGISVANKYQAPSLESIGDEVTFMAASFGNIRDYHQSNPSIGMESAPLAVSIESVIEAFDWDKTPEEKEAKKVPASYKW